MRALGIDFGEDSIKIAELIQIKKQILIQAVFEKKLSQQVSEQDRQIEAIEFIRSLATRLDFNSARVIFALKQDKVTLRHKQFPFADRLKILKSLSFEMEEDIPFDPELCVFDAKTILNEGYSAHVLAIAAPKSHIEKTLNLAKDFGAEPYTLTVDGLAFANLIENWQQAPPVYPPSSGPLTSFEDDENADLDRPLSNIQVTLNLGHKKTLVIAQIDGRVIAARSLLWGADQLIQELVRKFQLPYLEAQRLLQNQATLLLTKSGHDFETANLASTLEKSLRELVREIQMSFLELQSEFHGEVKAIYLTGGLASLPNIGAFFTQHFEVATNPVSLVDSYIDTNLLQTSEITVHDIKSRFAMAVGIALEAYKKPKNPALQFMRGDFASDNNALKQFWQDWGSVAQIGAVALVVLFTWASFRESLTTTLSEKGNEALKKQAKEVARLPKKQANEKGVKKYISENKKRSQEFKLLQQISGMNSALDVLKKLSESSPSKEQAKIDLVKVQIKDDLVEISGYANSPREVTLLNQRLNAISLDKKVIELQANLPQLENRVTFSMSFKTDRGLLK